MMGARNFRPYVLLVVALLVVLMLSVKTFGPNVSEISSRVTDIKNPGLKTWFTHVIRPFKVNEQFVHIYDIAKGNREADEFKPYDCVTIKNGPNLETPICIYDPKTDIWVSGGIFKGHQWEKELMTYVFKFMDENPDMEFLDLGCNIGAYTVSVAKYGRRVVSVDPNRNNLIFLSRSLTLGGLQDRVTLIWNAISDKNEMVKLNFENKNVGGTFVRPVGQNDTAGTSQTVMSITLNNITDMFRGKRLLIKMDIQEHEWYALQGATEFFDSVHITHILMEWVLHKKLPSGGHILNFLMDRKFSAYNPRTKPLKLLDKTKWNTWPFDVLWIKS